MNQSENRALAVNRNMVSTAYILFAALFLGMLFKSDENSGVGLTNGSTLGREDSALPPSDVAQMKSDDTSEHEHGDPRSIRPSSLKCLIDGRNAWSISLILAVFLITWLRFEYDASARGGVGPLEMVIRIIFVCLLVSCPANAFVLS